MGLLKSRRDDSKEPNLEGGGGVLFGKHLGECVYTDFNGLLFIIEPSKAQGVHNGRVAVYQLSGGSVKVPPGGGNQVLISGVGYRA